MIGRHVGVLRVAPFSRWLTKIWIESPLVMALTHQIADGVLRVQQNGAEVLVIHANGRIVTRSVTSQGRLHVQEMMSPRLIAWLVGLHAHHERLLIIAQPLPPWLPATVTVRSVFAFFPGHEESHPLLLAREPLTSKQLRQLRCALPPVTAVVNRGDIHIPRASRNRARGL